MELFENNENINPKSLNRIGLNTNFKNNFQLIYDIPIKNQNFGPRTPLIKLENSYKKCLKYPLLKSISSSNINLNNNKRSNNINDKYNYEDEKYNENALKDEPKDFMHMNENKIYINNNMEYYEVNLSQPKTYNKFGNILENNLDNNCTLAIPFDDGSKKKKYDDYFNSPDED